jgi:hypothetical protein
VVALASVIGPLPGQRGVPVDGGSAIVSTVRPSGGAGAWDFAALDAITYPANPE